MKEEKRIKIFLALTSIHRKIKNNEGKTKIKWYSEFMNQGIKNPNEINWIKKALIKMKIIKVHNNLYSWNKQMTLPNPKLVDGIYTTIKQMKEEEKNTVSKKDTKIIESNKNNYSLYTFISSATDINYTW